MVAFPVLPSGDNQPGDEETDRTQQLMNLLFGDPGDDRLQAAVPNPKTLGLQALNLLKNINLSGGRVASKIPGIGKLFKGAGAARTPAGKFAPNLKLTNLFKGGATKAAQPAAEAASKVPAVAEGSSVLNSLSKLGLPIAAVGGALSGPGQDIISTAVTAARGPFRKEDPVFTETPGRREDVLGIPSLREDVIEEVSTRAGINMLGEGPEDKEAGRLAKFEDARKRQELMALSQAEEVKNLQGTGDKITQIQQNIAEEIAGLKQSAPSQQDEFTERLGFLLGSGLPSALAGNTQGVASAIQGSQVLAQQAQASRVQADAQIKELQERADKMLGLEIQGIKGVMEGKSKVSTILAQESGAMKENIEQTRKAEDEGRLDSTLRKQVADSRYDSVGVTFGGDKLFRKAGEPELSAADAKTLEAITLTQPIMEQNLLQWQRIINEVGATGSATLSEPVTVIDPDTGEELTFNNAAAAMESMATIFKANVKDIEKLGALGQDVLQFTSALIDDPTGYMAMILDQSTGGGMTSKIGQQIDVLVKRYRGTKDAFFDAKQLKTLKDINAEKLDLGEFKGFSRLPEDQIMSSNPERTIKMTDPEDGKVFLLTPQEFNKVIEIKSNEKRRR